MVIHVKYAFVFLNNLISILKSVLRESPLRRNDRKVRLSPAWSQAEKLQSYVFVCWTSSPRIVFAMPTLSVFSLHIIIFFKHNNISVCPILNKTKNYELRLITNLNKNMLVAKVLWGTTEHTFKCLKICIATQSELLYMTHRPMFEVVLWRSHNRSTASSLPLGPTSASISWARLSS